MLGGVPKTQMPLRYYVFDAFTNSIFKGNPAAVVFLPQNYRATIPDSLLQSIALEFNLAETAFVSPRTTAGHFDLRWFTPTIEFPLCGHATLATAAALLLYESQTSLTEVSFYTLSGILHARRLGLPDCRIEIELPAGDVTALSTTDSEKVAKVILQAFSKVTIKFIGTGSGTSFQHYLLVEVEDVSLEDAQINSTPLVRLLTFLVNNQSLYIPESTSSSLGSHYLYPTSPSSIPKRFRPTSFCLPCVLSP